MALFVPVLVGAAGGAVVGGIVSPFVSAAVTPLAERESQVVWSHLPWRYPSPDALIQAYLRQLFPDSPDSTLFADLMLLHGCKTFGDDDRAKAWRAAIAAARPRVGIGEATDAHAQGLLTFDEWQKIVEKAGGRREDWLKVSAAAESHLTNEQGLVGWNRGVVTDEELLELVTRNKLRSPWEFRALKNFAQVIPGPSDLVRFILRDVFDEDAVIRLGLDDEYDLQRARYEFWCARQGLGEMTLPGNPDGRPINWPQMYYRASWTIMSPHQGYLALQRLRPTGGPGGGPRDPSGVIFTRADLNSILKFADYPLKQRAWLENTSFNVLTRVDARRMYSLGVLGVKAVGPLPAGLTSGQVATLTPATEELREIYQDQGYNRRDAERLTHFTVAQDLQRKTPGLLRLSAGAVKRAYRAGALSRQQAITQLQRHDLTAEQAAVAVRLIDVELLTERVERGIATVRGRFFRGDIARFGAEQELRAIGVDGERVAPIVDGWVTELLGMRREFSAEQNLDKAKRGLMGRDELIRRLRNLHYADDDIFLMLASLEQDLRAMALRAAQQAARTERQRARADIQAMLAARREAERLRRLALGRAVKSDILRWVRRRFISPTEAINRLVALGWTREDALRLLAETQEEQPAAPAPSPGP